MRRSPGDSPGPRQPPFGAGQKALSTGLWLPRAFRRVAFASWAVLLPLKDWASLTVGLLAASDFKGVATFCTSETRGGGCLLYPGAVVPAPGVFGAPGPMARHRRLDQPPVPANVGNEASSEVDLRSPVPSFPSPARPDGSDLPWTLPLASPQAVASLRRRDREPIWALLGVVLDHSTGATSCRTRNTEVCRLRKVAPWFAPAPTDGAGFSNPETS